MIPGKIREDIAKEINWEVAKALGIEKELKQTISDSKFIYFDGKDTFYLENVPEKFKEDMKKFVEGLKAFSKKKNPLEKLNLDKIFDKDQKKFNRDVEKICSTLRMLDFCYNFSCFEEKEKNFLGQIITSLEGRLEKYFRNPVSTISYEVYKTVKAINKFSDSSKSLYFEERPNRIVVNNFLDVMKSINEVDVLIQNIQNDCLDLGEYLALDLDVLESFKFIERVLENMDGVLGKKQFEKQNLDERIKNYISKAKIINWGKNIVANRQQKKLKDLILHVQLYNELINKYYNELNKFVTEIKQNDAYTVLRQLWVFQYSARSGIGGFYNTRDDVMVIPKKYKSSNILHEIIHRCGTYSQNKYLKLCAHPNISGRNREICEFMTTLLTYILIPEDVGKLNEPNNAYDFAKHIAANLSTDRLVELYKNIAEDEELLNKEPEEFFKTIKYLAR